jgi:hypothetical protein
MIQRIIVEDRKGITVLNNPLKEVCQREDIELEFAKAKLPVLSIDVDVVGVALIRVDLDYV